MFVTLRKAGLRKQRPVVFSLALAREVELTECTFVVCAVEGTEVRFRPMRGSLRNIEGQRLHRISKDGKREHAAICTRRELLPEQSFPSGRYPAHLKDGWIVVSMGAAEKKHLGLQAEQKLARPQGPQAD